MTGAAKLLLDRSRGISVGIYAAPLGALGAASAQLAGWGARLVHFDVMDGVFVPQITGGPAFVKALGDGLVRDVHLMVADPDAQVDAFAQAGADIITIHAEAATAATALAAVRAASARLGRPILAGLGVMPGTPLEQLDPLLALQPDMILMLSLDPRTGTPPDLALAGERLRALADRAAPARPLLALDGGVTEKTIALACAERPDIVVSGSAIFGAPDPEAAYRRLDAAWAGAVSEPESPDVG